MARALGRAFRHRIGHIIRTSSELAEAMAILARRIHGAAHTLLPPYAGNSSNRGEWIEKFSTDYRKVDGKTLGGNHGPDERVFRPQAVRQGSEGAI